MVKRWKKRCMFDRRWLQQEDIGEVIGKAWRENQQGSRLYKVNVKSKKSKWICLAGAKDVLATLRNK